MSGLRAGALWLAVAVLLAVIAVLAFASPVKAVALHDPVAASCEVREAGPFPTASVAAAPPHAWPATLLQRNVQSGSLDLAMQSIYELGVTDRGKGYGRLERIDWHTHHVTKGPAFRVGALTVADGSLWVYGTQTEVGVPTGPVLCQVNPRTLDLVRQVAIPAAAKAYGMTVTAGTNHTIWVGYGRTVVHVDADSGATLQTFTVPSGSIADLSTSPDGHVLYISLSYPTVGGAQIDAQVLETNPDGTVLAATSASTQDGVGWSVAGGQVVGVPGGVAYSARTGMDGATVVLTRTSLAMVIPPGDHNRDAFDTPPGDVFSWPMDATMLFGGGSLWVANAWEVLACIDPVTSTVRAVEGGPHMKGNELSDFGEPLQMLGIDPARHRVDVLAGTDLYAITAPAACWK